MAPPGRSRSFPWQACSRQKRRARQSSILPARSCSWALPSSTTAEQPDGFYSVFTRPDGVDLSGVEIAATAFANMLTGRPVKPASATAAAALAGGLGLTAGIAAALLPALVVVPSTIAAASLYALAAQAAFNRAELWLPLATPLLLQLPLAVFLGVLGQYVLVQRQRRRMTQAISYYLPEKVAADLREGAVTAPGDRGETVYATCLASDLENFTAIAETMTPEAVARYLNGYFAAIAQPIKRHGADVLEFRADGVMCAWTATAPLDGLHAKACHAALDVIAAARDLRQWRAAAGADADRHSRRADLRRPCRRRRALRLQHHRRHRQHRLQDRGPEQAHRDLAAGFGRRRRPPSGLRPPPRRPLPSSRQALARRHRRGARPPGRGDRGDDRALRALRRGARGIPRRAVGRGGRSVRGARGGPPGRRAERLLLPSLPAACWSRRPIMPSRSSSASTASEGEAVFGRVPSRRKLLQKASAPVRRRSAVVRGGHGVPILAVAAGSSS